MTQSRKKPVFSGLLVLAVMILIFHFSGQNAEASTAVSEGLLDRIIGWFRQPVEALAGHPLDYLELENVLRKLGHFSEYALLGFCLMLHLLPTRRHRKPLWAWGISTAYAATDELHQFLSEGRSPGVTDVLIDSCGALAGLLVLLGLIRVIGRIRRGQS